MEFAQSSEQPNVRVILVGTTHPGNIGATARAMKNMGLSDLALVRPKIFPHEDAAARASGAEDILDAALIVDTLDDALADCTYVAGASARSRTIGWPSMTPRECAPRLLEHAVDGRSAIVFGPEKSGLTNDDLDRCHTLLTIPTDPGFSSLNLAMAVQVMSYELRVAILASASDVPDERSSGLSDDHNDRVRLATGEEMQHFYAHLEAVLVERRFLDPDNPRQLMRRLRRFFSRSQPDQNEINILRGILAAVERRSDEES